MVLRKLWTVTVLGLACAAAGCSRIGFRDPAAADGGGLDTATPDRGGDAHSERAADLSPDTVPTPDGALDASHDQSLEQQVDAEDLFNLDADPTASSIVFITSRNDLNGVQVGLLTPGLCDDTARAANIPGTFRALLSDSTRQARDLAPLLRYPVINVVGETVKGADFFDGQALEAEILDEFGNSVTHWVWTGSTSTGFVGRTHCNDWTSIFSTVRGVIAEPSSAAKWLGSDGNGAVCNNRHGLYCIRVGP